MPIAPRFHGKILLFCLLQVAECTSADVPPPSEWAAGFHALVLGPASCGILRLVVDLLELVPEAVTAQVGTAGCTCWS